MGKILTRFVSSKFEIEEGTLVIFSLPSSISQDLSKVAEAFSTFTLRSGTADIEIDRTGQIQGWLTNFALRRAVDGALTRINFCSLNLQITDGATDSGQFNVDLSSYKEVVLRPRQQGDITSNAT